MAKAATKEGPQPGINGVHVKTIRGVKSFRRAGFEFNEHGFGFALDAISKEQLKALEDEPNLIVEECTFADGDDFIKA